MGDYSEEEEEEEEKEEKDRDHVLPKEGIQINIQLPDKARSR